MKLKNMLYNLHLKLTKLGDKSSVLLGIIGLAVSIGIAIGIIILCVKATLML